MFHYFTLPEIYEYAAKMGYTKEQVEIQFCDYDETWEVSFGYEYTEVWRWEFESLDAPATWYERLVWED